MLRTILIFSPLIALFLLSVVSFVFALRSYRFRREKRSVDPNERSVTLLLFGAIGLAGSGSILLFAFTLSRTIFLVLLICGIILFFIEGVRLRRLVITGKEYFFSLSTSIIGISLMVIDFPLLIHMQNPFTALYVCIILLFIAIQGILLASWKKKRKSEISISIEEQVRE